MTERYNKMWGNDIYLTKTYNFTNQRIATGPLQNPWGYDADGRATLTGDPDTISVMTYDASGQMRLKHDKPAPTLREDKLIRYNNGDGRELKRVTEKCEIQNNDPTCTWMGEMPAYYVRSTVLGGEVIAEVGSGGQKAVRYVRAGGVILAHLKENPNWGQGGLYDAAYFEQTDAAGMSFRTTKHQAPFGYGDYSDLLQGEFDPASANVGTVTTYNPPPGPPNNPPIPLENEARLYVNGEFVPATVDGVAMNWQAVRNMSNSITIIDSMENQSLLNGIGIWEARGTNREGGSSLDFIFFSGRGDSLQQTDSGTLVSFKDAADALAELKKGVSQDCRKKLNSVLSNLKDRSDNGNSSRKSDLFDLFEDIASQYGGGGMFFNLSGAAFNALYNTVYPGIPPAHFGGGGTFGGRNMTSNGTRSMYLGVYPQAVSPLSSTSRNPNARSSRGEMAAKVASARLDLLEVLIHEMFHASGRIGTFEHSDMDDAARTVDSTISPGQADGDYFTSFLLKHCGIGRQRPGRVM